MLEYKKESYNVSLKQSREWQKTHKVSLKRDKIDFKISSKILEQCVMVTEGKLIYLTEEQWDWLYDYLLYAHRDLDFWWRLYDGIPEEEEEEAYIAWKNSLNMYTDLFEREINSFLETNLPTETFRCAGCSKELDRR